MNRSREMHNDELFLAWRDHSYANGALAGWRAGVAFMEANYRSKQAGQLLPDENKFFEAVDHTRGEALRVIIEARRNDESTRSVSLASGDL